MKRKYKSISLLIYLSLAFFFNELVLRISITGGITLSHLFYSFLFSISLAIIIYILSSLFKEKIGYIIVFIALFVSSFIFSSQLIYYKFFKTFYTLYSASNAGQILNFWKDILIHVGKNFLWLLLLFLPTILFFFLKEKLLFFNRAGFKRVLAFLGLFILLNLFALSTLYFGDRQVNSPYDLYFKSSNPLLTVQELGLVTSMRLDGQRFFFKAGSQDAPAPIDDNLSSSEEEDKDKPELPEVSPEPTESEDPIEEEVEEIVEEIPQGPNIMNIDFDSLIANEEDDVIKGMHEYFKSVEPTMKNEYTGKYEGYNLILLTAEGFSPYAVDENVTPTLYKMVNEGYNFTDFYTPIWGVSTSDGEYVALTSLLPKKEVWSFYKSAEISLPFVMGRQFESLGYKTLAYHNHTFDYYRRDLSHPNMGYDYKGVGNGLEMDNVWPRSDLQMMEITIPDYIDEEHFHAYYMTVSGHMQYSFSGNAMARKNKDFVEDLPYTNAGKAYLACHIELDKAMEYLLDQLEEKGIADKTLIAMSADHYPYGLEFDEMNDLAGHEIEKNFELYKNVFILYTKDMEPITIDKPASSLDILPTLSNLLGLEYDSRLMMGRDIFSDSSPLLIFLNHSFITDKGRYNAIKNEFIPLDGVEVDQAYIDNLLNVVKNKFYYSTKVLETDYYKRVLDLE